MPWPVFKRAILNFLLVYFAIGSANFHRFRRGSFFSSFAGGVSISFLSLPTRVDPPLGSWMGNSFLRVTLLANIIVAFLALQPAGARSLNHSADVAAPGLGSVLIHLHHMARRAEHGVPMLDSLHGKVCGLLRIRYLAGALENGRHCRQMV